jgi:hypothetical protein
LMSSLLPIFAFVACNFGVTSKKSLPNSISWNFFLIHSFTCRYPVFPQLFAEETFFPLCGFGTLSKIIWPYMWGCFPGLSIVFH